MNKLLMVMVLGASAVAASAQSLHPRRTLGSRLSRSVQPVSQSADAAGDLKAHKGTSEGRTWTDPRTGICWHFVKCYDGRAMIGHFAYERLAIDKSFAGDLVIPEELDGCAVKFVYGSGAFKGCDKLTSIRFPKTMTRLDGLAHLKSLTNVTIEAGNEHFRSDGRFITSLDGKTLRTVCAGGVKSIAIPEGITKVDGDSFQGASWLEEVRIPSTVREVDPMGFHSCTELIRHYDPTGRGFMVIDGWLIPFGLVKGCELVVPDGVRHIARVDMFANAWPNVSAVKLPEGLLTIGRGVFAGSGIETVEFPASLQWCAGFHDKSPDRMRRWRPNTAHQLRNVIFRSGKNVFGIPDTVTNIVYSVGVTEIDAYSPAGDCAAVTSVRLPEGLMSIGVNAFARLPELTDVVIPSSVTNIGYRAFSDCPKLKSVGVVRGGKTETMSIDEFRKQWKLDDPSRKPMPTRIGGLRIAGSLSFPSRFVDRREKDPLRERRTELEAIQVELKCLRKSRAAEDVSDDVKDQKTKED